MTKTFRVVSVSKNANSFGLHGHILVARDGSAFEVGRNRGPHEQEWDKGADVVVEMGPTTPNDPAWWTLGGEIPRALPTPPPALLKEIFGE